MKGIARDGTDYEFTTLFELDVNHCVRVTKDRTGLFLGMSEFQISSETGVLFLDWCSMGKLMERKNNENVSLVI